MGSGLSLVRFRLRLRLRLRLSVGFRLRFRFNLRLMGGLIYKNGSHLEKMAAISNLGSQPLIKKTHIRHIHLLFHAHASYGVFLKKVAGALRPGSAYHLRITPVCSPLRRYG